MLESNPQTLLNMKTSTLLGDTDSLSSAAGGLGMLPTNTKAPVVPQTTVISVLTSQKYNRHYKEDVKKNLFF